MCGRPAKADSNAMLLITRAKFSVPLEVVSKVCKSDFIFSSASAASIGSYHNLQFGRSWPLSYVLFGRTKSNFQQWCQTINSLFKRKFSWYPSLALSSINCFNHGRRFQSLSQFHIRAWVIIWLMMNCIFVFFEPSGNPFSFTYPKIEIKEELDCP